SSFLYYCSHAHRDLHSFPTRRSSDLRKAALFDRQRGSAAAWLLTLARRTALNFHQSQRRPVPAELGQEHGAVEPDVDRFWLDARSEEHTSELQSRSDLVCRLLLEKKK